MPYRALSLSPHEPGQDQYAVILTHLEDRWLLAKQDPRFWGIEDIVYIKHPEVSRVYPVLGLSKDATTAAILVNRVIGDIHELTVAIFTKHLLGEWSATYLPADGDPSQGVIAVNNETVAVGLPITGHGVVHLYQQSPMGEWVVQKTLKAPDHCFNFGQQLWLSDDNKLTVVTGMLENQRVAITYLDDHD